jgi:hypothetical protein
MFNQKIQKQILSTFKKETKDARKIAEKLNLSRRNVMDFLSDCGLRIYSEGSFN